MITDLEQALGQYTLYQSWLRRTNPERLLYLAVDTETARGVFDATFGQIVAEDPELRLLVIDMPAERIMTWRQFPGIDRS